MTISLLCDACIKYISRDDRHMTRSVCAKTIIWGKRVLASLTPRLMSSDRKVRWRCKAFRSKSKRSGINEVDVSSYAISTRESTPVAAQILAMKETLNTLLDLPGKENKLLLIKPCIDLTKASVEEVETSIFFWRGSTITF